MDSSNRDLSGKDTGMCPHGNFPSSCVQCKTELGNKEGLSEEQRTAVDWLEKNRGIIPEAVMKSLLVGLGIKSEKVTPVVTVSAPEALGPKIEVNQNEPRLPPEVLGRLNGLLKKAEPYIGETDFPGQLEKMATKGKLDFTFFLNLADRVAKKLDRGGTGKFSDFELWDEIKKVGNELFGGIEIICPSLGSEFDGRLYEFADRIESGEYPPGVQLNQVAKYDNVGYKKGGNIIRKASVTVAR
ncbi:MAG: hypothetical protein WA057_01325 [Candidatus Magasanikiibacteriota bacterium]